MNYQAFIEQAKKKGFTNIQITIDTVISNEVYYVNNQMEDYSDTNKTTYTIKAEYKGKIEQLHTEYLDESILKLLIEKIELTDANYENEFLKPRVNGHKSKKEQVSVTKEIDKIKELYKMKAQYLLIKTIEFFYGEEYLETRIVNSSGADISTSSHTYKFSTEAIAEKNGVSASFAQTILVTKKEDINFEEMVKSVLENATLQVNKQKLETKKYNLILDSNVVASIISSVKDMISAQSVHKKISCLTNKLNEKIFSDKLTILEEPLNKNYPGYTVFDKEGVETTNKTIIENGVLKTYIYDTKEAKVDGRESTGNYYGDISTRNLYLKPSIKTLEELLKKMKDGIYITDKMGSSGTSISESTGNISIQVFGFVVKDGKIIEGFIPSIMSTTIFELLSNIEDVGNDLTFKRKDIGAPSLYIKDISIASE